MGPVLPFALAAGLVYMTFSLVKRATTLRYQAKQGNDDVWNFTIYRGEKIVHVSTGGFASKTAAETAAKIWISTNPNAGR